MAGCDSPPPPALPTADPGTKALPLDSLATLGDRPRGAYTVRAYVEDVKACPPCKGPDPCSPRPPTGLSLVDHLSQGSGLLVPTTSLEAFHMGARYEFTFFVESPDSGLSPLTILGAKPVAP